MISCAFNTKRGETFIFLMLSQPFIIRPPFQRELLIFHIFFIWSIIFPGLYNTSWSFGGSTVHPSALTDSADGWMEQATHKLKLGNWFCSLSARCYAPLYSQLQLPMDDRLMDVCDFDFLIRTSNNNYVDQNNLKATFYYGSEYFRFRLKLTIIMSQ